MSVKRNIFIILFIFLITILVKAENHIKKISIIIFTLFCFSFTLQWASSIKKNMV